MSLSTQQRPVGGKNPFEIFTTGEQSPKAAGASAYSESRPSQRRYTSPKHSRPQPQVATLPPKRKPRLQYKPKVSIKAIASLLGLLVVVFSLLPVQVQKRVYAFLRGQPDASVERVTPLPVAYDYISSPFGRRWGRQHQGVDFAAAQGSPIYATSAGTVIHSGWEAGYGKSVVIDHGNGTQTRYAHCSKLLAKKGNAVMKGALIAKVGSTGHSTGPHLHFEVIVDGVRKNPAWYYSFERGTAAGEIAQESH